MQAIFDFFHLCTNTVMSLRKCPLGSLNKVLKCGRLQLGAQGFGVRGDRVDVRPEESPDSHCGRSKSPERRSSFGKLRRLLRTDPYVPALSVLEATLNVRICGKLVFDREASVSPALIKKYGGHYCPSWPRR